MTKSNLEEDRGMSGDTLNTGARHDENQGGADDHAPARASQAMMDDPPPPPRRRVFVIAVLGVACLLAYGGYEHWQTSNRADEAQQDVRSFVPEVQTITAKAEDGPVNLSLPGQTAAFDTATIYPRATGYIAERKVDIGSRVKKGDLLVRIAAPDLDQQLAQARGQLKQVEAAAAQAQASLDQAKANQQLASITAKRISAMAVKGYETEQNNDNQKTQVNTTQASVETAEAGIKVASANIQAQQATVDRLIALTAFERVLAPFDGIVVTRGVDNGDLVNADSKTGTALFTVAKDTVLRISVNIPQQNAVAIHDGLPADVTLPQLPDKVFSGKITRSSVALQYSARTLNTEVDVDNAKGELRPGAFVNVTFHIPRLKPNVVLPAEALIFNQNGLQVAVVQDDEIHMQKITIYRDFGRTVELSDGLNGGETIVINPPTDLGEHSKVKVKETPPKDEARK